MVEVLKCYLITKKYGNLFIGAPFLANPVFSTVFFYQNANLKQVIEKAEKASRLYLERGRWRGILILALQNLFKQDLYLI